MKKSFIVLFFISGLAGGFLWSLCPIQSWDDFSFSLLYYLLALPCLVLPYIYYLFYRDQIIRLKRIATYYNILFFVGYFPRISWLYIKGNSLQGEAFSDPGNIFLLMVYAFFTFMIFVPLNAFSFEILIKKATK